jgi:hypothetical protein
MTIWKTTRSWLSTFKTALPCGNSPGMFWFRRASLLGARVPVRSNLVGCFRCDDKSFKVVPNDFRRCDEPI